MSELRDEFAGLALQAMLSGKDCLPPMNMVDDIVSMAFHIADRMVLWREHRSSPNCLCEICKPLGGCCATT